MRLSLAWPALLCAAFAVGCAGDNSGCGGPPKAEETKGGAPTSSGKSPGRSETVQFADAKGRVPLAYRKEGGGQPAPRGESALAKIVRREVDGVKDKVEVFCPTAKPAKGKCLEGPHFSDMKELCCPDGLIERCLETTAGALHIVGRGCGPAKE